ncbi:hypothetical protein FAGKG844_760014 [Frankia sp. AgKG'84/4]
MKVAIASRFWEKFQRLRGFDTIKPKPVT